MDNCTCLGFHKTPTCPVHGKPKEIIVNRCCPSCVDYKEQVTQLKEENTILKAEALVNKGNYKVIACSCCKEKDSAIAKALERTEMLTLENEKQGLENVKLRSMCGDHGIDISELDDPNDVYVPSGTKS